MGDGPCWILKYTALPIGHGPDLPPCSSAGHIQDQINAIAKAKTDGPALSYELDRYSGVLEQHHNGVVTIAACAAAS
jgi:hypothetical protein